MGRHIDERFLEKWADAIAGIVGTDEGLLDRWISLFNLMDRVRKIRPARSFALDGRYSLEDKISFFSNLSKESLGNALPDSSEIFLAPLIEGNLWNGISILEKAVLSRFDEKVGRVVVEIHSPTPLSADSQAKIVDTLVQFVNERQGFSQGKTVSPGQKISVKPIWKIRPELIAGLEIRIGSHVWDASLSARIRELGRQLLKSA